MHEDQFNKAIGFGIVLIISSYVLQLVTPLLIWVVGILIAFKIFTVYIKHK